MTKVYSFEDHQVVLSHPDVGTFKLSDGGIGRVVVAYSGEKQPIDELRRWRRCSQ